VKISARNQFEGTISAVRQGAINDEIDLEVAKGISVVATVTQGSRKDLGLAVGAKAFALVKASSVMVATETEGVRLSARNQLPGKVVRVTSGAVNTEVVIRVIGDIDVVAVVTNESASNLQLAAGSPAIAIFKATSVVIGVRV
jgi:molybdate transport system regulatory protein